MCIFNKKRVNSTSEVKNMDKISVVVPCYNEEEALPVYYKEMCRVMDEMKDVVFELIFVDDGSSDATLGIMKDLNEKDSRCRYLSFSRNFGKEAAIYAGLKASEGDYVALMDVDLQDPPTLLPEMYEIDPVLLQVLSLIRLPLFVTSAMTASTVMCVTFL